MRPGIVASNFDLSVEITAEEIVGSLEVKVKGSPSGYQISRALRKLADQIEKNGIEAMITPF